MTTDNTIRSIILESELPKCIICLSDTPITTTYSGVCTCHPHIHEQCLESWFRENPGVCPICRIVRVQTRDTRIYNRYSCLFCTIMCVTPFAVIIFLILFKAH